MCEVSSLIPRPSSRMRGGPVDEATKYRGLPVTHSFTPVAIETTGAIGPKSLSFLKDLGRRVTSRMRTNVQPPTCTCCNGYLLCSKGMSYQ